MSLVSQLIAAGVKHCETGVASSPFRIDGVAQQFNGVYNGLSRSDKLIAGGMGEDIDSVIVCSRDQFTGHWVPDSGFRLFVHSKAFQIVRVEEDEAVFRFELRGINS